ncbi:serine/threonine protein kinase [Nitzschia inconspicua]|uniref:Serine/threonine protein kinase n=1 Tax=Nitzschia inconspicua TaxID=303405 RepID=A0A9K3M311_9STRA|nr:serine/threonine protein kinase [Nitzschia inconspicua]
MYNHHNYPLQQQQQLSSSPHYIDARRKQSLEQQQQQQCILMQQQLLQQQQQQHQQQQVQLAVLSSLSPPPPPPSTSPTSPFTVAHIMADSIHSKVKTMLHKTRLTRQTDQIQFLQSDELITHGLLGAGAFSQVTCVTNKRDQRRYACKHLQPKLLQSAKGFLTAATELAYETHLLSSLRHPHIVQVHGWAANGIASFEQGQHDSFFLLLDLLEETLDQRIEMWKQTPSLSLHDRTVRKLHKLQCMTQIANALEYIHSQGVIYRDLKPQNIGLLNGTVKLFDFGLSRELPLLDLTQRFRMSGKVGTIRYMAPEVCLYQPYNIHCDIYSWSMVAYELLSEQRPFEGFTPDLYTTLVCQQGLRPVDPLVQQQQQQCSNQNTAPSQAIPTEYGMILEQAWHAIPERRLSLQEIQRRLSHLIRKEQQQLVMLKSGTGVGIGGGNMNSSSCDSEDGLAMAMSRLAATSSTSSLPPPPPPNTCSPETQQSLSPPRELSSSSSFYESDGTMMQSSIPQFQQKSNHSSTSLASSIPTHHVIDLSSDDDDDIDQQLIRSAEKYNKTHHHQQQQQTFHKLGMSNETPTYMMRRKRISHNPTVTKRRGYSNNNNNNNAIKNRVMLSRQTSLPPLSGNGISRGVTGNNNNKPVLVPRRRHSSDDFDSFFWQSTLSGDQDFVSELKDSDDEEDTITEVVEVMDRTTMPKKRRSADSVLMSQHLAEHALWQQQQEQQQQQQQQQEIMFTNGHGSSSSSSCLDALNLTPPNKQKKQRSWTTATTATSSSTSIEDTWSEDSNFVFEQWSSGRGSGSNNSFF